MIDALLAAREMVRSQKQPIEGLPSDALDGRRLILVTGHRRESFGTPLEEFCMALRDIVEEHSDGVVVYPVHLNPNITDTVFCTLGKKDRVYLIPPLEYLPFLF